MFSETNTSKNYSPDNDKFHEDIALFIEITIDQDQTYKYWEDVRWENKGRLNDWDVSKVTTMSKLFLGLEKFNEPIGKWNVSNVTDMEMMFTGCEIFNQPLDSWNVSKVTNMRAMFAECKNFNQPLSSWDVSNVTNMDNMFYGCESFNQPLGSWNVGKVEYMSWMFYDCKKFNQPLNSWAVSNDVYYLEEMFSGCESFNQPLNKWNLRNFANATSIKNMFKNTSMSPDNYPNEEAKTIKKLVGCKFAADQFPVDCENRGDFFRQARIFHPDKNQPECKEEATKRMQHLNEICSSYSSGGKLTRRKSKRTGKKGGKKGGKRSTKKTRKTRNPQKN